MKVKPSPALNFDFGHICPPSIDWGPWRNRHELVREAQQCPHFCPHEACPLTVCSDALKEADIIAKAQKVLGGGGYTHANEQFALWFRNSMSVLILKNAQTMAKAITLQHQLNTLGIRAKIEDVSAPNLQDTLLAQDSTILHNLTGKSRTRLFWICQGMARKRFNLPLRIHGEHNMTDPIATYRRHFEAKKR